MMCRCTIDNAGHITPCTEHMAWCRRQLEAAKEFDTTIRSAGSLQLNWARKGRVPISGVYVRAQHGKAWVNCDVNELTASSFLQFLRSFDRAGIEHVAVAIHESLPLRGGL